jgi:two-component system CheB/CheR fusion protein
MKVLIVEDNPDDAELLCRLLEKHGYEVRIGFSGVDGVALARDWQPDVVLSDLAMPEFDGYAVAWALRPTGVRLIAVSGSGNAASRRLAQDCGYEAFVTKPATLDALLPLLEAKSP